ncbi:MAG: hypothetical protein DI551_00580 [Micavibrio aeruginosavorus]|uniref:Uncharacterized protein n=1 Tax=Micavibrio aeruginosavorus TaxID=349221 RepID=A0A2W5N5T7_9BACT|nr:MAG: hypothetical protein DI551_00580 [Micavibrio aeruginosavorus]
MTIQAKRKDGTPVSEGDRVFAVWTADRKSIGKIMKVNSPVRFTSLKNVELQTYTIRCADGTQRPAHAWHIKIVYEKGQKSNVRLFKKSNA